MQSSLLAWQILNCPTTTPTTARESIAQAKGSPIAAAAMTVTADYYKFHDILMPNLYWLRVQQNGFETPEKVLQVIACYTLYEASAAYLQGTPTAKWVTLPSFC
jgi:hypothetical protein